MSNNGTKICLIMGISVKYVREKMRRLNSAVTSIKIIFPDVVLSAGLLAKID